MHTTPFLSLVFVGASAFTFDQVREAKEDSKTAPTATESATSFSFTAHTRHAITTTTSSQATSPSPKTSASRNHSEEDDQCVGVQCGIDARRPLPPKSAAGHIDFSMPCWAMRAIEWQCFNGPDAFEYFRTRYENLGSRSKDSMQGWEFQSPEVIRTCLCSSQYADMLFGCGSCHKEHGLPTRMMRSDQVTLNSTLLQDAMRKYCDADTTPTEDGMDDAMLEVLGSPYDPDLQSSDAAETSASSFHDPIGNATDVSLYFTPSMTGSAAHIIDMPTASFGEGETRSNGLYTYSSLPTSDGQVVPTAQAVNYRDNDNSGDDGAESISGTTTAAAGAMQTAKAFSGAGVGALGLAMLVIAL